MTNIRMDLDIIFRNLENTDNTTLFKYIFIITIFLAIFQRLLVGLNIVFGIILAVFLILYFNSKKQYNDSEYNKMIEMKKDYIRPKPLKLLEYTNLVNFIYSIQDFYIYNPQSYENMIDEIDNFLLIYEEAKNLPNLAGINYGIMEKHKQYALNHLHSLIFGLPSNISVTDKLNRSIDELDNILSEYHDELYNQNKINIAQYGYNNSSILINTGPKEKNYYEDREYTYNVY